MLRTIEMYTNEYKDTTQKEIRKKKGQFFTPAEVSMRMAAVENKYPKNQLIRVLDPGAGNGILSFAVIDKLLRSGYKRLDITLIETDTEILPVLEYTITKIRQICESYHAECTIHYIDQNFVLWESSCLYDIVICNPPYMKVRKDSIEATAMKAYVYGQPNLYGLFMAKAVELLRDNGQYIFITPRSWTSGKYFTKVRSFLQKELNIKEIDLFSSRDEVFQGEKVLQETMILYGEKGQIQNEKIKINILKDGTLDTGNSFWAAADQIKFKGSEQYLLLPENENDLKIIDIMSDMTDSFESSGYHFKTGPVVEFRNLDHIHKIYQTGDIPMYRSIHIQNGTLQFPADTQKAQYVSADEESLLIPKQNTILVRRLSMKEDLKRIQACKYFADENTDLNTEFMTVENHVNYLTRKDGTEMTRNEIDQLFDILMSDMYERYIRLINGSTQINAGELNKLPLQRMER